MYMYIGTSQSIHVHNNGVIQLVSTALSFIVLQKDAVVKALEHLSHIPMNLEILQVRSGQAAIAARTLLEGGGGGARR